MGAKKKTSVGLLVFGSFMHQTNLAELVTDCGVTVITFMSLNNKFLQLYYIPILHTAWLESHALTLKNNTAKYYFDEKSSFLQTFLKFSPESRTVQVIFKNILQSILCVLKKVNLYVWQTSHHLF